MNVSSSYKYIFLNTDYGERPFTDLLIKLDERNLCSRYRGHLSQLQIQVEVDKTVKRKLQDDTSGDYKVRPHVYPLIV